MPKMPPRDPKATAKIAAAFKDGLEKGSADPEKYSRAQQAKMDKVKPMVGPVKSKKPMKKEESVAFYDPEHGEWEDLRDDLVKLLVKAGLAAKGSVTVNGFYVGQHEYAAHGHFLEYKRGSFKLKGADIRAATREAWLAQAVQVVVANEKLLSTKKESLSVTIRALRSIAEGVATVELTGDPKQHGYPGAVKELHTKYPDLIDLRLD